MTRLAYLGPPGTFSEEAALRYQPSAELLPLSTEAAVVAAVDSGEADEGVLAIENSIEGSVTRTLDALIHESELSIRHELILPIEHCLIVRPGMAAAAVSAIYAHPQALNQCRKFLDRCFPDARQEAALSNSAAVEETMGREGSAAIGTGRAAQIYGAEVLARGIQDRNPNVTRFVILAREDHPRTGDDKTSFACAFAVEDRPGLLVGALEEFSQRSINLSKIESRPSRERLGTYIFLMDIDGHRADSVVAEALKCVKERCSFFRVLGSYPRYREPAA